MTKKFWNDWKNRGGEIKQIYLVKKNPFKEGEFYNDKHWRTMLLAKYYGEKVVNYTFYDDEVVLTLLKTRMKPIKAYPYYVNEETKEILTVKRKDVISVEFEKYSDV